MLKINGLKIWNKHNMMASRYTDMILTNYNENIDVEMKKLRRPNDIIINDIVTSNNL